MSAILAWIAWNFAIGWPNAWRSLAPGDRSVERALREANGHRRHPDPAAVEDMEELLQPAAAAQQV